MEVRERETRALRSLVCSTDGGSMLRVKGRGDSAEISCAGDKWVRVDGVLGAGISGSSETERFEELKKQTKTEIGETLRDDVIQGYNLCCFSCGQPYSGQDEVMVGSPSSPGLIASTSISILNHLQSIKTDSTRRNITLKASLFELTRNGAILDLLSLNNNSTMLPDPIAGIVPDVKSIVLNNADDFNNDVGTCLYSARDKTSHLVYQSTLYWTELGDDDRVTHQVTTLRMIVLGQQQDGVLDPGFNLLSEIVDLINNGVLDKAKTLLKQSFLTYYMSEALGGNCITTSLGFLNPADLQQAHTVVEFASAVRKISSGLVPSCFDHEEMVSNISEAAANSQSHTPHSLQILSLRKAAIQMLDRQANSVRKDHVWHSVPPPTHDAAPSEEVVELRRELDELKSKLNAALYEKNRKSGVDRLLAESQAEVLRLQEELRIATAESASAVYFKQIEMLEGHLTKERAEVTRVTAEVKKLRKREKTLEEKSASEWKKILKEREVLNKEMDGKTVAMRQALDEKTVEKSADTMELENEVEALHEERKLLFKMFEEGKNQYDALYRQVKRHGGWRPAGPVGPGKYKRRNSIKHVKRKVAATVTTATSTASLPNTPRGGNETCETSPSLQAAAVHDKMSFPTTYRPKGKYEEWYYTKVKARQKKTAEKLRAASKALAPSFKPLTTHYEKEYTYTPNASATQLSPRPAAAYRNGGNMGMETSPTQATQGIAYAYRYSAPTPRTSRADVLAAKNSIEQTDVSFASLSPSKSGRPSWREELEAFEKSLDEY